MSGFAMYIRASVVSKAISDLMDEAQRDEAAGEWKDSDEAVEFVSRDFETVA